MTRAKQRLSKRTVDSGLGSLAMTCVHRCKREHAASGGARRTWGAGGKELDRL